MDQNVNVVEKFWWRFGNLLDGKNFGGNFGGKNFGGNLATCLMARIRPSIMSEGATMSAPALAKSEWYLIQLLLIQ